MKFNTLHKTNNEMSTEPRQLCEKSWKGIGEISLTKMFD